MKKLVRYIFILLILFACNKEQVLLEEINGTWKIDGFSITDNEGLRYEGLADGQLTINSSENKYLFQLNYQTFLVSNTYNYNGDFSLINNNKSLQLNHLKSTNETYTFEFKLKYASKDYLKIEYWDESYRLNTLLFKR